MRSDNGYPEWRVGARGGRMFVLRVVFGSVAGILWSIYELVRMAVVIRFRFSGAYWRWRMETAFGGGMPESKREMVRSLLEYGRWVHAMRRGGV
jgi:hypothetical protein